MQADISKLETEGRNPTETSSAPASNYLPAYLYDILYMSNIYLYEILALLVMSTAALSHGLASMI